MRVAYVSSNAEAASNSPVIAGAIRWDAWYDRTGNSVVAQEGLSPEKYHYRAPAHCHVVSPSEINCAGDQVVIDSEIRAAAAGGLSFWAFDWYQPGSSLRKGWNYYQSSQQKDLINWCGIVPLSSLGSVPYSSGKWRANMEEWAGYMAQACYQKVRGERGQNRPLLFVTWSPIELRNSFGDSLFNVNIAFAYLRQLVVARGLGDPYIVIVHGIAGAPVAAAISASAIGNYTSGFARGSASPYRELDYQTRQYWAALAATGEPIVPIAMVGWDARAKLEKPVPWEPAPKQAPDLTNFYVPPTPIELAIHMQAAVDYINLNPTICVSKVLLIYAWDECFEGGGLIPTLGDPTGRCLSAIARVLHG